MNGMCIAITLITLFSPALGYMESEFQNVCLLFAKPSPKIQRFLSIDNSIDNLISINLWTLKPAKCTYVHDYCFYHRLKAVKRMITEDQYRLMANEAYLNTVLITSWKMDRVFSKLNCRIQEIQGVPRPIIQWKYVARWSNLLTSRDTFCKWSRPLASTVAKNLRGEVKTVCDETETDNICYLRPIFDFVDSMEHLCSSVSRENWKSDKGNFKFYQSATYIYFYVMKLTMPVDISGMFGNFLTEGFIKKQIYILLFKLLDDFKANDMSLARNLLKVLPKSMYLPCDYNAQFPSYKWIICSTAKVFDELRIYVQAIATNEQGIRNQKFLTTDIDMHHYIRNLRSSQLKMLTEKSHHKLLEVATDIKNNVQARFTQLGAYFKTCATFQQRKLNADVEYLKDRINGYMTRFNNNIQQLKTRVGSLLKSFQGAAAFDLFQAVAKMIIRIAKAGNPFKWLFDSGNADDILESVNEIAEASRLLHDAIRSMKSFENLVTYNQYIATKLKSNQKMLKNVKTIIDKAKDIIKLSGKGYEALQSNFLQDYTNYSPGVTKDELVKLDAYWSLFIDDICSGIASTSSSLANVERGASDTTGECRRAKREASQLVAIQQEIYDLQFELMETMANLMGRLTQIQSSKILGKGPKAKYPDNLSIESISMLTAVSSLSYNILQTTSVNALCDIMEYRNGRRPDLCNGMATNIDKLLALSKPTCRYESKYVTVSTKRSNKTGDYSWLDIARLYKGETVAFQIPNSKWWIKHARIPKSQRHNSFFLSLLEIYMPTKSKRTRSIYVYVTPTNIDNRLRDDSKTKYVLSPIKPIADRFVVSYLDGINGRCKLKSFTNPYFHCGHNVRPSFTNLCFTSQNEQNKDQLLPSIYSKFNIRIEGYEDVHLSEPVTDVDVVMGIQFCSVNQNKNANLKKKQQYSRSRRSTSKYKCCSQSNHYYSESEEQCQPCPVGSKSYYNSMFCGELIVIRYNYNRREVLTFDKAVSLCQQHGSVIASSQDFQEARKLGQRSCKCGWKDGSLVDSLTERQSCSDKSSCKTKTHYVHCKTVFST